MAQRGYIAKSFSASYDFNDNGGIAGFNGIDINIGIGYAPIVCTFEISRVFTSAGVPNVSFGTAAEIITAVPVAVKALPIGTIINLGISQRIDVEDEFGLTSTAVITDGAGVFYMSYYQLQGTD